MTALGGAYCNERDVKGTPGEPGWGRGHRHEHTAVCDKALGRAPLGQRGNYGGRGEQPDGLRVLYHHAGGLPALGKARRPGAPLWPRQDRVPLRGDSVLYRAVSGPGAGAHVLFEDTLAGKGGVRAHSPLGAGHIHTHKALALPFLYPGGQKDRQREFTCHRQRQPQRRYLHRGGAAGGYYHPPYKP